MKRSELIVEVRNRQLERVGTITSKYLDLSATLRDCNVGEWKLRLPAQHPMVGELTKRGSGIVVSSRGADTAVVPPTYGPGSVDLTNRVGNPDAVSSGTAFTVSSGIVTWTGGAHRVMSTGGVAMYVYPNAPTSEAVGGRFGVSSGQKYAARVKLTNPNAATIWVRLSLGWYIAAGSAATPGSTSGTITALAAGASVVLELVGIVPTASSGGAIAGTLPVVYFYSTAAAANPTAGQELASDEWALYTGSTAPAAGPLPFVSGSLTDGTELGEYVYAFTGAANSTTSTRTPIIETSPLIPAHEAWDTLFSGPTSKPTRKRDRKAADGELVFEGVTDEILLADALAFPSPGVADPAAQTQSNDVRTDEIESLLHAYVARNIGALAPSGRRRGLRSSVVNGADLGRGIVAQKSPRFQNLLELLQELVVLSRESVGEQLSFTLRQVGDELVFGTREVADRRASVRLDIENGTITSQEVAVTGPTITQAIVAGQGEGVDRTIVVRTTAESVEAEDDWGRPIERFIDQRNTNVTLELEQAGDAQLLEKGFTATAVKVIPSDDQTMRYLVDWREGDLVTVVVDEQETSAVVTAAALIVNSSACKVGAAIGDVVGFDKDAATTQRVDDIDVRVGRIERTDPTWDSIADKPTTFPPAAHTHDDRYYTEAEVAVLIADARSLNKIVNGDFRINQRGYVSGASLTPGLLTGYGHDRWGTGESLNLVSNGSFETNTTGWAAGNCTATRVNTWAQINTWSLSLSAPATNDSYVQQNITTVIGRLYTVSAYARLSAALTGTAHARARAIYVTDNTVQLGLSAALPNVAGSARLSTTFVATTTTTTIRLYNGHTGGTIWWDGVSVTEGATLPDYADQYSAAARSSYTFTQAANGCVITLNSGGTIRQFLEHEDMPAASFTLSWEGTARARIRSSSGSLITSSATSPLTFTNSGSGDRIVEFEAVGGTATLSNVNLVAGVTGYPFQPRPIQQELALCQRFYRTLASLELIVWNPYSAVALNAGAQHFSYPFPVEMRRAPVVSSALFVTDWQPFTYYNSSAGAAGNYNSRLSPTAKGLFAGEYSAAYSGNGGITLAAGRAMGYNLNPIYLSAEF